MSDDLAENPGRPDPTLTAPEGARQLVTRFGLLTRGAVFSGRYLIEARIGTGGSGEVYRALDRVANIPVALKVLFPRSDGGSAALGRLRRELQILRGIHGPGIVEIHDIGEHEGLLYLVMELLAGQSLRERLSSGSPLTPDDAARILRGILEALTLLHAAGAVHRDVKPANVVLARRRGTDAEQVVLLDFGLARCVSDASLTVTGEFLGTPEYVSPEQARGERQVGSGSDIYSAGIVLWEMLSGAPPFVGDSAIEVLNGHCSRSVVWSRHEIRRLPAHLRKLAVWMLDKSPGARPDAEAALRTLAERRVPARPKWRARVSAARRHGLAGIVVLLVALVFAGYLLVPVRVQAVQDRIVAASAAGIEVRTIPIEGAGSAGIELLGPEGTWNREHLVLLRPTSGVSLPAEYPHGLARVDPLTGRTAPFWTSALLRGRTGFPLCFPRIDASYSGHQLHAFRVRERSDRVFVATYHHADQFPALFAVFSQKQPGVLQPHPGWIWDVAAVDREPSEGGALLVFLATSHHAGMRAVVFAVPLEQSLSGSIIAIPPFELDLGETERATFYTFLSTGYRGGRLEVDRDRVDVVLGAGRRIPIDIRTGAPKSAADRGGLSTGEWSDGQQELTERLMRSGKLARNGTRESSIQAAQLLEEFAESRPLSAAQQGVAFARAAELRRRAGQIDVALKLVRRALEAEGDVPGHYRLLIDLETRRGRWLETLQELDEAKGVAAETNEVVRDLIVAGLVSGHPEDVRKRLNSATPDAVNALYGATEHAFLALHDGEGARAAKMLDGAPYAQHHQEYPFLRALALAIGPQPGASAERQLEMAEGVLGAGQRLPVRCVRAYLDVLQGRAPRDLEAVELELREQHLAGRENVIDLYFAYWAEAFAARAFAAAGDQERAARHAALARSAPGEPGYLRRILEDP